MPVLGIILFIILYIIAAFYYPGGSDINKASSGFSWQHNYWCELMASTAQNGEKNTARPIALSAMAVLMITLIIFWNQVSDLFRYKKINDRVIRYSGSLSMLVVPFLLTGSHDMVMNIAGLFGCVAIFTVLANLYSHRMMLLFWIGVLCLLLCGANNYVYYTTNYMRHLPVLQKITFVIFLAWFAALSVRLYRK